MATVVDRLIVDIDARTRNFEKALKKVEGQVNGTNTKMAKSFKALNSQMLSAGKAFAGAFGVGFGLGALTELPNLLQKTISTAANLGDVADRVGLTTDRLQELQYGAVQAGMGLEQLDTGLIKFAKGLAEAAQGQGQLLKIFEANGVAVKDAEGKQRSLNDMLDAYADLVKNAANQQDRLFLIMTAFGEEGRAWEEFLRNGAAGLQDNANAAREAGAVIDQHLIRRAQLWDDAWSAATHSITVKIKDWALTAVEAGGAVLDIIDKALDRMGWLGEKGRTGLRSANAATGASNYGEWGAEQPVTQTGQGSGGGGGGQKKKSGSAGPTFNFDRDVIRSLAEQVAMLEAQRQAYGLSEGAAAALLAREQALLQVRRQGREATPDEIAAIEEQTAKIRMYTDAMAEAQRQTQLLEEIGQTMISSLEGAFSSFLDTGKVDFKDFVNSLLKDLARLAFSAMLRNLFGGGSSGGGGGDLFSALLGGLFGKAGGGPVAANRPVLVGERGPELFVPPGVGSIIPNGDLGRSGPKASFTFAPTIDARGADAAAVARLEASMVQMHRDFEKRALRAVQGEKIRNPSFGRP